MEYTRGILVAVGCLLLFLAANHIDYLARRKISGWRGERLIRRLLREAKLEARHDVYLPVGPDGRLTQVDHLVLAGDRIAVLETKNHGGRVRGQGQAKTWQQRFGGIWWSFLNPNHQNDLHLRAVMEATGLGRGAIQPLVVFPRAKLQLACGPDEHVVDLEAFQACLATWSEVSTAEEAQEKGKEIKTAREAWGRMLSVSKRLGSKDDLRDRHLRQLGIASPLLQETLTAMGAVLGAWLVWRFGMSSLVYSDGLFELAAPLRAALMSGITTLLER